MSGTVTLVETQRKQRGRVNIYIDDQFAFSLTNIVAESAGLRQGLQLADCEIRSLLERDSYQRAFDTALNFLSYRPRSEAEVRANLRRKKIAEDVVDRVMERLRETKLVDDSSFAEYWLQNRETFSPRGWRAIRMELRHKGVPQETIDETLPGEGDEAQNAYRAASKKATKIGTGDFREFRQKLGAYLVRRGFDYDVVSSVVGRLWRELKDKATESESAQR